MAVLDRLLKELKEITLRLDEFSRRAITWTTGGIRWLPCTHCKSRHK